MHANAPEYLQLLVSSLAVNVPVLLVCVAAVGVTLTRWSQGSKGSSWALVGFGLAGLLCIIIPLVQAGVHTWIMRSGEAGNRAFVFSGLSLLWSVLRAATYALLLVAVFAGRQASRPNP